MKKLFILLAAVLFAGHAMADEEGSCTTSMTVQVQDSKDGIPAELNERLASRLRQAVILNGIEGGDKLSNFNLVATTHEVGKEVLSGNRPMVAITVEMRLQVSNALTSERLAATTITASGAGRNEQRAYQAAVSALASQNRPLQLFMQDARRRIMAYYDNQAPYIIKQAKAEAKQYKFERAMFLLQTIPVCSKQYEKVEKAMKEVFQMYLDRDCAGKIAQARNVWNAYQNRAGALLAGAYLAAIDPNSSCASDAAKLEQSIRERIGDEWEFYKEMRRDSLKLEEKYIEALKVIGKAYAKNQGDTTINIDSLDDRPAPVAEEPQADEAGDGPEVSEEPEADDDEQADKDEKSADDGDESSEDDSESPAETEK